MKTCITLFPLVILFSCALHDGRSPENIVRSRADSAGGAFINVAGSKDPGYLKIAGDSIEIRPFEIAISLSAKAEEELTKDKETVIVAAYFTGEPRDTTTAEYKHEGEIFIAARNIELAGQRKARFEGIKFSKGLYDALSNKDIKLLINVFSGRRSTNLNLLDCGIISLKMSKLETVSDTIKGRLIGERNGDL